MKKEYLDYLYEQKAKVQLEIDELVKMTKQDRCQCCKDMDSTNPYERQLHATRHHILGINKAIESYLSMHK